MEIFCYTHQWECIPRWLLIRAFNFVFDSSAGKWMSQRWNKTHIDASMGEQTQKAFDILPGSESASASAGWMSWARERDVKTLGRYINEGADHGGHATHTEIANSAAPGGFYYYYQPPMCLAKDLSSSSSRPCLIFPFRPFMSRTRLPHKILLLRPRSLNSQSIRGRHAIPHPPECARLSR